MPGATDSSHQPDQSSFHSPEDWIDQLDAEYGILLRQIRQEKLHGPLRLLDYGTGRKGLARLFLEQHKLPEDQLDLYDPHAQIHPPAKSDRNVRIITQRELMRAPAPYDVVTLSFVLCCLEPQERSVILSALSASHPQAHLLVLEYILKQHDRAAVCALLQREAKAYHRQLEDPAFLDRHTALDLAGLANLLEENRWQVWHIMRVEGTKALLACRTTVADQSTTFTSFPGT